MLVIVYRGNAMRRALTAIAFLVLSIGCHGGTSSPSTEDVMKSYLWHNKSDVIAGWGPPQNIMPDGLGGEAWTYTQSRQYTTGGSSFTNVYGPGMAATTYVPGRTYVSSARQTFFINGWGIVYRYAHSE
jgi:hypothetical protein